MKVMFLISVGALMLSTRPMLDASCAEKSADKKPAVHFKIERSGKGASSGVVYLSSTGDGEMRDLKGHLVTEKEISRLLNDVESADKNGEIRFRVDILAPDRTSCKTVSSLMELFERHSNGTVRVVVTFYLKKSDGP